MIKNVEDNVVAEIDKSTERLSLEKGVIKKDTPKRYHRSRTDRI